MVFVHVGKHDNVARSRAFWYNGTCASLAQRQSSGIVNRRCQSNSDRGLQLPYSYMISSRLGRFENRKAQKRLLIAVGGSIGILLFLALFGLKILVGFSLLVDRLRGASGTNLQSQSNLLLPPVIDPIPEATFSSTLSITGRGTAKTQVIIYVNDQQFKKFAVNDDGTFTLSDIPVDEGDVTLSSKIADDKGNTSDLSNIIKVTIDRKPPTLELTKPDDGAKIQDGTHKATVEGKTDEDSRVSINDRIVVVRSGGSFTYSMPLSDGENTLKIVAIDPAGNHTTIERRVTYQN